MRPYFQTHDGDGPHALLVHGILASRAYWLPNLEALRQVCRPVVVELYGHGRSDAPEDRALYHPDAYVAAFEEIRESVGAERWFVIGHSLGAALSLRYVLEHPSRVVAHVFMNSNSALADGVWRQRVRAGIESAARAIEEGGSESIREHPLHPARGRRTPSDAREALVRDGELHTPSGVANTFRHTVPDSPVRDRLRDNERDALLVVGVRERAFAEHREYAERVMPRLEVVEADAGHPVSLHAADTFNTAVTRFLSRRL